MVDVCRLSATVQPLYHNQATTKHCVILLSKHRPPVSLLFCQPDVI